MGMYLCWALKDVGLGTGGETLALALWSSMNWSWLSHGPTVKILSKSSIRWGYACETLRGG
jgi:hypothetical protein